MTTIQEKYTNHAEIPYIAEEYQEELLQKPISKWCMIRTKEGFLPGHIILLWRIQFETYHTEHPHHKYFYTTYGIDAQKELDWLIDEGYVAIESALSSKRFLPATRLKSFLKQKGVTGLSQLKRTALDELLEQHYQEEELAQLFSLRGYQLTNKGQNLLDKYPEIVAKHPQKKY